jgi:hypothetical protein
MLQVFFSFFLHCTSLMDLLNLCNKTQVAFPCVNQSAGCFSLNVLGQPQSVFAQRLVRSYIAKEGQAPPSPKGSLYRNTEKVSVKHASLT